MTIMVNYSRALLIAAAAVPAYAFTASSLGRRSTSLSSTPVIEQVDKRTGKPTGTSFLPQDAIDRAAKGNPIEKAKGMSSGGSSMFRCCR